MIPRILQRTCKIVNAVFVASGHSMLQWRRKYIFQVLVFVNNTIYVLFLHNLKNIFVEMNIVAVKQ